MSTKAHRANEGQRGRRDWPSVRKMSSGGNMGRDRSIDLRVSDKDAKAKNSDRSKGD
jgi:hypothetical protein